MALTKIHCGDEFLRDLSSLEFVIIGENCKFVDGD